MSLPERLGRLRRIERIGAGGFATVWRYHDDELDSDVAVKALADNWAQRLDIRERFLAEARILRKADTDRVVRVYDIGETEDGTPYFVMSYADRGTVADLIQTRVPLPTAEVLDILRQAGAGFPCCTATGSCIVTSNRRICCSPTTERVLFGSWSPIWVSPRRWHTAVR